MANIYLDICLSDIPKERIKTAQNGKKYLKAIIRPRKETDRDGYDHYIAAFIPSNERRDGEKPAFIGRAQVKLEGQAQNGTYSGLPARDNKPSGSSEDFPF